jgi:hypothetical protein
MFSLPQEAESLGPQGNVGRSVVDDSANGLGQSAKRGIGPGIWVKPWDRFADAYADSVVRVVIGIRGVEGEFYAFVQRNPAPNEDIVRPVPPMRLSVHSKNEQVPVLVDVIECANDEQIAAIPSVVWFGSIQKREPRETDVRYLSLFDGSVKVAPPLPIGEADRFKDFGDNLVMRSNGVSQVVKGATQVMDGIPYGAYERNGDALGQDKLQFMRRCRIRVTNRACRVIATEGAKTGLEIVDVLIGPLQFIPRSRYVVQG